jgi:hypothetical protein
MKNNNRNFPLARDCQVTTTTSTRSSRLVSREVDAFNHHTILKDFKYVVENSYSSSKSDRCCTVTR